MLLVDKDGDLIFRSNLNKVECKSWSCNDLYYNGL